MLDRGPEQLTALAEELTRARQEFIDALADVDPALLTAPGLAGEWSAKELIAHVGYWVGHAAEAIHHAEQRRAQEFGADDLGVDERNAVVARVAKETDLRNVQQREELAYQALLTAVTRMDPAWLEDRVSYGDTIELVIRDDGADHYREHTADVRAWFTGTDDEAGDEEQLEEPDEPA